MSTRSIGLSEALTAYMHDQALREPETMARIRKISDALPESNMRSSAEQAQFLMLLLKAMGARTVIEVGVFTGYGTLAFALALPADGRVIALDVTDQWLAPARKAWDEAGVGGRIDLRLGPAADTLAVLKADGLTGQVDFAYIDADKEGYVDYYEHCLGLLRSGGIIAVDNVLWSGRVIDPHYTDADTRAIRAFNDHVRDDDRVDLSMLPLGDGLTLALKR